MPDENPVIARIDWKACGKCHYLKSNGGCGHVQGPDLTVIDEYPYNARDANRIVCDNYWVASEDCDEEEVDGE